MTLFHFFLACAQLYFQFRVHRLADWVAGGKCNEIPCSSDSVDVRKVNESYLKKRKKLPFTFHGVEGHPISFKQNNISAPSNAHPISLNNPIRTVWFYFPTAVRIPRKSRMRCVYFLKSGSVARDYRVEW